MIHKITPNNPRFLIIIEDIPGIYPRFLDEEGRLKLIQMNIKFAGILDIGIMEGLVGFENNDISLDFKTKEFQFNEGNLIIPIKTPPLNLFFENQCDLFIEDIGCKYKTFNTELK